MRVADLTKWLGCRNRGVLPSWILGLTCVLQVTSACTQQPVAGTAPESKPLTVLQSFEDPADHDYELGRGDEISVDFAGRPELNCKRVVGPDGRISIAPAGSISVGGETREAAAGAIVAAMSIYYSRLSVTVGVDRYISNRVLVLGAVEHPGVVPFDKPPTLLEVITQSGGLFIGHPSAQGLLQPVGQKNGPAPAIPERCAIYRGTDQVLWVDLRALLERGSSLAGLRLKRDDVVYIPEPSERYVSVLGQVQHPGAMRLDDGTTLAKVLAEAGGLTVQAGKSPNVQVIQPSTGKARIVPFRSLLQPGSLDLTLRSGDVVYVPESTFNQAGYVFQQISPLLSVFTAAVLFQH